MSKLGRWSSLLVLFLITAIGCSGNSPKENPEASAAAEVETPVDNETGVVHLLVQQNVSTEYAAEQTESEDASAQLTGKNEMKFDVPWKTGATAFSVLKDAKVPTESTGQGETRFVSSINGQANEGSGGANWIFSVNGETGNKSCDATQVKPGDEVKWSFGDYVME